MDEWFMVLAFLLVMGGLMVLTSWLHTAGGWRVEHSRKFMHVSGGILCLFIPCFFHTHWPVLVLVTIAFILLLYTYRKKQFAAIHEANRPSIGSVLFPIPVYATFFIALHESAPVFFYLPVSLLTFSDTAAEAGGQAWGKYLPVFFKGQKTLAGSLSFFISALVVITTCYSLLHLEVNMRDVVLLAIGGSIAEGVGLKGWDNITIPVITIVMLYVL